MCQNGTGGERLKAKGQRLKAGGGANPLMNRDESPFQAAGSDIQRRKWNTERPKSPGGASTLANEQLTYLYRTASEQLTQFPLDTDVSG